LTGAGASVISGRNVRCVAARVVNRPTLATKTRGTRSDLCCQLTHLKKIPFPIDYLEVRRLFILGTRNRNWKATINHRFFELSHLKTNNKQTRIYTQNIDGLQRQYQGLPIEKFDNVHGTISEAQCSNVKLVRQIWISMFFVIKSNRI